jgi:hypothetical protein
MLITISIKVKYISYVNNYIYQTIFHISISHTMALHKKVNDHHWVHASLYMAQDT